MNRALSKKYTQPILRNESGIALVMALLSMALLTLMGTAALTMTEIETKISANDKSAKEAFYIAEAGIEHAWAILKTTSFDDVLQGRLNEEGNNGRLRFGANVPFSHGVYDVMVADNDDDDNDPWNDSDGTVIVTSTGATSSGPKQKIEVVVQKITPKPVGLKGSVTSNGTVVVGGNVQVDGRNHNINGVLIEDGDEGPGTGTLGLSTARDLVHLENSSADIGGTSGGIDYEPSNPGSPFIIQTDADWEAPTTPEAVLGLKGEQLKALAMGGINGKSQYVIDPTKLRFPLGGITYVELPNGGIWDTNEKEHTVNFDGSTGILIVHNEWRNAVIYKTSHGTFKGIIIADTFEKIQSDIIGAVVTLSSDDQRLGTGKGKILYSREAIDSALKAATTDLTSIAWREGLH